MTTQAPAFQNIPFVAGKSLSKSHNLGIRIQETKSLMSTQLNKLPKSKQTSQVRLSKVKTNSSTTESKSNLKTLRHDDRKNCPVLKHQTQIRPKFDSENNSDDINIKEKGTINEIWADYMFEVENKKILPVRCTCFTKHDRKPIQNKTIDAEIEVKCKQQAKATVNQSAIYLEAKKVMNDCRVAIKSSDEEIISKDGDSILDEDYKKKTRTTKMARYMQRIKRIHERLT